MRKYLYTTLLLALLAQEGVMAQENEGKQIRCFGFEYRIKRNAYGTAVQ